MSRLRFLPIALAATLLAPMPAMAQTTSEPASLQLSEALRALARDPQSLTALLVAAEASLALDNTDASLGFVQRAEAIAPADGRVIASRAAVLARQQQPLEALRLFAAAEQAGGLGINHVAERGLAYDLIGDNAHAQQDYAVALAAGANPAVTRRLALSQAIAGDQRGSEATLLPLLQRTDLAAYRTRAFALAIMGRTEEAVSIAETMLPARLSSRMAPYLRYMPRLTRAQQAAAANLGTFPQAAQIGRDDPALAAYTPQTAQRPAAQTADARLVPSGEPLGSGGVRRREEVQAAPPSAGPERVFAQRPEIAAAAQTNELPAEQYGPPATVVASLPPEQDAPRPSIAIADASPAPQPVRVSDAFADLTRPASAGAPAVAAAGAVDITQIQPRRDPPPAPPPPPRPVHPSRHWVQVATGRDTGALAFDWRRLKREAGGVLDRSSAFTARWGQTNRLVIGPFSSTREADAMVTRLKGKDIDSFRFTSDAGQEVKPLG